MFLIATIGRNRLEEIKLWHLILFLTHKLPFNLLTYWEQNSLVLSSVKGTVAVNIAFVPRDKWRTTAVNAHWFQGLEIIFIIESLA